MKRKIIVSTIVKDNIEVTERFFRSLHEHKERDVNLYVQNNDSDKESSDWLSAFQMRYNYNLILNDENYGFSKCHNKILDRKHADYYVIANNDIEFTGPWIEKFMEEFRKDPLLYLVSGVQLNENGHDYGGKMNPDGSARSINKIREIDKIDWTSFALCMIRRDCIFNVGLLDERFKWYYEDVDYCLRIREAGYNFKVCTDVEFKHVHHASSGFIDPKQAMEESKNRFMEKWQGKLENLLR